MIQNHTTKIVIHSGANIMNTLPRTMKINRMTSTQLGNEMGYTQSNISKMSHGKTELRFDSVQSILGTMPDNQFLAMDIANRLIGVSVPIINGNKVMKESLAMAIKAMPELHQSIEAIKESLDELTIPIDELTDKDLIDPMKAINESWDVVLYLTNFIAFVSEEHHLSMQQSLNERNVKWKMEGITA